MKTKKIKITGFSPLEFFVKNPAKDISFLHSSGNQKDENWSIMAWGSKKTVSSFSELNKIHKSKKHQKSKLPFCGGFIGYIDFDGNPNMRFYEKFFVYNKKTKSLYTSVPSELKKIWGSPIKNIYSKMETNKKLGIKWTTAQFDFYKNAFRKIKRHIKDGDIYQINLTRQLTAEFKGDFKQLFLKIIKKNPAPFSAYLDFSDIKILSTSPERFISLKNKILTTCPVKGTIKRTGNIKKDAILKKKLLSSQKEEAELNMITDLLRNDLGEIAKIGTVKVSGHRLLQTCETVFHTYSKITAKLKDGLTAVDVLSTCLPGGSITGCPKKIACQIIKELEPIPRGIYTGVIAYIDNSGNMDSGIIIRTLIATKNKLNLGVGGGIVADSKLSAEFKETNQKAKAFLTL